MRGFYYRSIKYETKMGNLRLGEVFQRQVETMASNWRRESSPFYLLDAKVRAYLMDNDIPTVKFPFYLSFSRKALMFYQKYSGTALSERINQLINDFVSYGLSLTILKNIIEKIIYKTPAITP